MSKLPSAWRVSRQAVASAIGEIETTTEARINRDPGVCASHANTLTWIAAESPDAVVFPAGTGDVIGIVRAASKFGVPLIAFGGGTSLEGHVNAPHGGLSIDFSKMDRILETNERDLTVRVESGVKLDKLNAHLEGRGVFFSVDPGAGDATLGGMAATRASGTNTVRYGSMYDNVLSVAAVMADASHIETATGAPKSAAGYDLTRLLVGSEGTLGLITELTLRLHPVPQSCVVMVCGFRTVKAVCDTVIAVMRQGIKPARIELLDSLMLEVVNRHSQTEWQAAPTLFVELHGSRSTVEEDQRGVLDIARQHGATNVENASDPLQRKKLWQARHDAFRALATVWPGKSVLATDVCVPLSRLSKCLVFAHGEIARLGLTAPVVGHVGDGNFHVLPVFDDGDENQRRAVLELLDSLVQAALRLGGTCTGEHGIGQGKIGYLAQEAGAGVAVMAKIKAALDPLDIFNPGKIVSRPLRDEH